MLNIRSVTTYFNNDTMHTTIHGWWCNARTIWAHLEWHNMIQFSDHKGREMAFFCTVVEEVRQMSYLSYVIFCVFFLTGVVSRLVFLKCEVDPVTRPPWLAWIKALCFIDRAIKGEKEEESRLTAPLVDGCFQLVSGRVGDGRGAWEFGQSFPYMLSLLWGSWPLCSPQAHQPLPSQCGSSRSYQSQD